MPRSQSLIWVIAAILCVTVYLAYFFSLGLPNAPIIDAEGHRATRWTIWAVTIIGPLSDTPTPIGLACRQLLNFDSMWQRVPVMAYATLILLAAGGVGDVVLRGTRQLVSKALRNGSRVPEHSSSRCEWIVFAFGLGMTSLSLGMLVLGMSGWMSRTLIVVLLAGAAAWSLLAAFRSIRSLQKAEPAQRNAKQSETRWWATAKPKLWMIVGATVASLFLLLSLLGAMLPATDFDVLEYHLQGPKEYYLSGKITFAPHNVYMNMPFGTEMLTLVGMIVAGDWWWGGLIGQTVLAAYAPLTAVGIAQLGRRCFGSTAGWLGAFLYLTTPWVYRISIIPLTENALAFYLLAAVLAARRGVDAINRRSQFGNWLLAGFMAGSAAACKYTALTSTVAPIWIGALVVASLRDAHPSQEPEPVIPQSPDSKPRQTPKDIALLSWWLWPAAVTLGVLLIFGPWLVRNAVWTGNPTYPLLYSFFGGRNWTAEKNAKWEWGHRVAAFVALGIQQPPIGTVTDLHDAQHSIGVRHLINDLHNVTIQSDWLSPLLFSLAPLALFGPRGRRSTRSLWMLTAFLFVQWWLLTHRNDRFWVPMLPILAVLAGGGCTWTDRALWRWFLIVIVPPVILFNFSFCTTALCGYNQFGMELVPHRHPNDQTDKWIEEHLPATARILAVGEAAFYHCERTVLYNTVFDDCLFLVWLENRTPQQAAEELHRHGITHLLVNWSAIQGHRKPGGYGFSPQVTPGRFRELVTNGVLQRLPIERADLAQPVSIDGYEVSPKEAFAVK